MALAFQMSKDATTTSKVNITSAISADSGETFLLHNEVEGGVGELIHKERECLAQHCWFWSSAIAYNCLAQAHGTSDKKATALGHGAGA